MRILLDECVDWRLLRDLGTHDVRTARQADLLNTNDAKVLAAAQHEFDVLITVDQELPFQQNVKQFAIAVVVLHSRTTRLPDLRRLLPQLHEALATIGPGDVRILRDR